MTAECYRAAVEVDSQTSGEGQQAPAEPRQGVPSSRRVIALGLVIVAGIWLALSHRRAVVDLPDFFDVIYPGMNLFVFALGVAFKGGRWFDAAAIGFLAIATPMGVPVALGAESNVWPLALLIALVLMVPLGVSALLGLWTGHLVWRVAMKAHR